MRSDYSNVFEPVSLSLVVFNTCPSYLSKVFGEVKGNSVYKPTFLKRHAIDGF
jgi:hypothetical protein